MILIGDGLMLAFTRWFTETMVFQTCGVRSIEFGFRHIDGAFRSEGVAELGPALEGLGCSDSRKWGRWRREGGKGLGLRSCAEEHEGQSENGCFDEPAGNGQLLIYATEKAVLEINLPHAPPAG